MMKFIWLGIYIFGILCQNENIFWTFKNYRYRAKKSVAWIYLIQTLIWPIYWLRGFIKHYLYYEEDFKG